MGKQRDSRKVVGLDEMSCLRTQLAISLKFHHCETLQNIPLEAAVRAMTAAWDTCHPEEVHRIAVVHQRPLLLMSKLLSPSGKANTSQVPRDKLSLL